MCSNGLMFQEEQLDNLRECMALNSASTSSDSDSEVSEVTHQTQRMKLIQKYSQRSQLLSSSYSVEPLELSESKPPTFRLIHS